MSFILLDRTRCVDVDSIESWIGHWTLELDSELVSLASSV